MFTRIPGKSMGSVEAQTAGDDHDGDYSNDKDAVDDDNDDDYVDGDVHADDDADDGSNITMMVIVTTITADKHRMATRRCCILMLKAIRSHSLCVVRLTCGAHSTV